MFIRRVVLVLAASCIACLAACDLGFGVDDGFVILRNSALAELGCSLPKDLGNVDMVPPGPACAAAKGLSGDILGGLCLDMDKINTQGLTTLGFDLAAPKTNCAGWEVAAGKLQPTGINTSAGSVNCSLSLPRIPVDAKYSRVTLALIHQASLPNAAQQARMELFGSTPLRVWVNPATTLAQRTTVEIDRTDIPDGPTAQATLQLFAPVGSPTPTWTISSIAVLGNP